jgi:hypothetical protein
MNRGPLFVPVAKVLGEIRGGSVPVAKILLPQFAAAAPIRYQPTNTRRIAEARLRRPT